ncbi:large exoprotein [Microbacterium sp. X-17]|uniref:large exoprotein n=1 Tax=Microbacterium sp. X-17 TaxID=3144404 RepID=UPI0031F59D5F
MDGQVLGGGVIVLVAVVLWLVYLLPSWHSRHQYNSAERNAVRLNQALRVLAESSETPGEVHLELSARTAAAQQRLARRALAERERAGLEEARAELEVARSEAAAAAEVARGERAAARALPAARRSRARRRARLVTTTIGLVALAAVAFGAWQFVSTGAQALLWSAGALTLVCALLLQRMSRVSARARSAGSAPVAVSAPATVQDVALEATPVARWQPRSLPRPLASSAGSRAAAVLDAEAARDALRTAAREEAARERAARIAPPSIDTARAAKAEASAYARMGYVDDAEIEAHVRELLARRAAV